MQDEYQYEDQYNYQQPIEYQQQQGAPDNYSRSNSHPESQDHNHNYNNYEPYEILPLDKIYEELNAILGEIQQLVYLDKGWCLLLLKEFKWDKEFLKEEYYNNMEHYQQKIGLKNELLPIEGCTVTQGDCMVCCGENVPIFRNICEHAFCVECWLGNLKTAVNSGNPFINCMDLGCGVPLLMGVIEIIFQNAGETASSPSSYLRKWRKRVCQLLILENRNYQFCTGVDCGNCIKINQLQIDTVKCVCGKIFCFRCQSDDHYPCNCDQKLKWVQQVISEQADAKWISSNAKICPWCKKAVQRSMGCNFMSCTCGKNFCYMCSQPWQPDHKDHFKCHIYKKKPDEIVNREKQVMERMNHCTQRFIFNQAVANNYKEIDVFAKRKYLFKVLAIDLTDSQFMETAYKFAIECCEKLKWIYAFTYFTDMKKRKDAFEFSMGEYEKYKENLLKLLAVDLKKFMERVEVASKDKCLIGDIIVDFQDQFRSMKKQIVNLYTCTKNYKEKFVQELLEVTDEIVHQKEKQEMKGHQLKRGKSQQNEEKGLLAGLMNWGKGSKSKGKKSK